MKMAIGVKIPKKIIPRTIGLTIIPRRNPNRIHSLFSGKRMSALTTVHTKSINDVPVDMYAHIMFAK